LLMNKELCIKVG